MKEIHKIVVPVDFSEHTEQLVEYAIYIGQKFEARLKFVYVIEPIEPWGDSDFPSLSVYSAEAAKRIKEEMAELVLKIGKKYSLCEGKVLQGDIPETIVQYAQTEGSDLIVIGTHGRKGLQKFWLGSVAERVIKTSPCPTMVCNPYK